MNSERFHYYVDEFPALRKVTRSIRDLRKVKIKLADQRTLSLRPEEKELPCVCVSVWDEARNQIHELKFRGWRRNPQARFLKWLPRLMRTETVREVAQRILDDGGLPTQVLLGIHATQRVVCGGRVPGTTEVNAPYEEEIIVYKTKNGLDLLEWVKQRSQRPAENELGSTVDKLGEALDEVLLD